MSVIYAIILGVIQGLTEFLPISSSGHLLLIEHIFGISEGNLFFNILLHIASLLAVVIIMRKEIIELIKHPFNSKTLYLFCSCLITIIVVLFLSKCMDKFTTIGYLGFGFLLTSVLIFITYIYGRKTSNKIIKHNISLIDACIIGFVQGFATLPGISRSGSTICTSILLGNDRKESANFSFLSSIPIILGAMLFEIVNGDISEIGNISAISCILGFIASFIVAFFSLKLMYKVVEKSNWIWFSVYLLVLAIFVLLNQFVFMWI